MRTLGGDSESEVARSAFPTHGPSLFSGVPGWIGRLVVESTLNGEGELVCTKEPLRLPPVVAASRGCISPAFVCFFVQAVGYSPSFSAAGPGKYRIVSALLDGFRSLSSEVEKGYA